MLLPTSLLALLFASPVLSAPTTPNDLFHDIAVLAPKPPEEPVCCLRPLPPLEPPSEDDLLLSFEEWKAKRLSEAPDRERAPPPPPAHKASEDPSLSVVPDTSRHHVDSPDSVVTEATDNGGTADSTPPHLRIPIHDRFNYASLDCSARVHAAHKSAKSPSSILSSKKDRYMLSPCAEEKQFVIVELCEDIRIDTVQLANYEFFSGVFKDFTVSVSKKYYPNDPESWTFAGTFRAKNVRGVQSFHPPPTLRGFYRFIRIDFHSHYGNEYYCPLSLLRVYGLTHLEEWQWETWDAESRAKRSAEEATSPVEVIAEPPEPVPVPVLDSPQTEKVVTPSAMHSDVVSSSEAPTDPVTATGSGSSPTLDKSTSASSSTLDHGPQTSQSGGPQPHAETHSTPHKTTANGMPDDHSRPSSDPLYNSHTVLVQSPTVILSSSVSSSVSSSHNQSRIITTMSDNHSSSVFIDHHPESDSSLSSPHTPSIRASTALPNISSLSVISPSYSHSAPPAPPASTGGESIYRLIMNRLTALEANTTLYARYVEEQTAGMREVLRRLSEDIGRLESIGKTQSQLYRRSVVELEKQTKRLESEHQALLSRVNHLTDEVVLEKRLGIAQLCLLLTVLVFMALTRGSRGEVVYPRRGGTMREWGRRTLSISGDWVNRLRTRSSTPPRAAAQKPSENEIAFPSLDTQVAEQLSRSTRRGPTITNGVRRHAPRPHTPTSLRTPTSRHAIHHRAVPSSPSFHHLPRPGIQRSSSGSMTLGMGLGLGGAGVGPVPKSAKRWARTAHLHEVKAAASPNPMFNSNSNPNPVNSEAAPDGLRRRRSKENDGQDVDVFSAPAQRQVLTAPALEFPGTISKGKARAAGLTPLRQPSPLRPSPVIDLASPRGRQGQRTASNHPAESEQSEGEGWVDTDVDGSECDLMLDGTAGTSTSTGRERTYPANNSL
ncbi:UNC-like C-terminal-domain-containing protein [Trametes polyzona]|nr:UNC-like C-terminal-domain-containing protein [Trametes polyzona]